MTIRTPFENRPLRTFQLDGLYQKRKQMHTLQNIDLSIFFCVFNDLSPVRALESPPLAPDIKFDTHSRRGAIKFISRFNSLIAIIVGPHFSFRTFWHVIDVESENSAHFTLRNALQKRFGARAYQVGDILNGFSVRRAFHYLGFGFAD